MSGGSAQRVILPAKNKKVAGGYKSKGTNKGPGLRAVGRITGFSKTIWSRVSK